jgi:aspartate ammonia-lyase
MTIRIEHDLLGDLPVPAEAYYGVHTVRAQQNFRVTDTSISQFPALVSALAAVKQAAAQANMDLGVLSPAHGEAIVAACEEIRAGALLDQFVLDPIQGGAGNSTNMNANEVIANRALELMATPKGTTSSSAPWSTSTAARAPMTLTPLHCASPPSWPGRSCWSPWRICAPVSRPRPTSSLR